MIFLHKASKHSSPDLRPPFTIAYGGGELLCVNLDTLGYDLALIEKRAMESEQYITVPSSSSLVLYALAETVINKETSVIICKSIERAKSGIKRLAVTGPVRKERKLLDRLLFAVASGSFEYKFFVSVDQAKDWLTGK